MLRRSVHDASPHLSCRGNPSPPRPASPLNSPIARSISCIAGAASTDWSKRCLSPVRSSDAFLKAEFTVREKARYDIAGSGWTPTLVSTAVVHARAGRRTSAETARVHELLREFHQGKQHDGEFGELPATVCGIWASRYSPTATELVVPDPAELSALLRWCKVMGLPDKYIEVRVPDKNHLQSNELRRIAEEHGLPAEAIRRTSRLRLAQDRVRGLARTAAGLPPSRKPPRPAHRHESVPPRDVHALHLSPDPRRARMTSQGSSARLGATL